MLFKDAKRAIALDNCDPLSSTLVLKYLSIEICVIAHNVATTLLPQERTLSTFSQGDTLFTFFITTQHKINLSPFILNYIIDAYLDPSSLPYRLVITHIREVCDVPLSVVPFIFVKQCYNVTSSMGYIFIDDVWVQKFKCCSIGTPSSLKFHSPHPLHPSGTESVDVELHLLKINSKFDTMKDLLLDTQFQLDKIKNIIKDVACLHVKVDQVIKEATKLVAKIRAITDSLTTAITTQFTNLKDATSQTMVYFFSRHPPAAN